MRPHLLALPLLALAAGCSEPCTSPALTVSWRFALADGTTDAGCLAAGVETVDLWLGDRQVGAGMSCPQGAATFGGLEAGPHDYTIQGRSAGGQLLAQQWGSVELGSCGETRVTLRPGAGLLRLDYATEGGRCDGPTAPGVATYVWYQVQDRTTQATVSLVNAGQSPLALPCQTPPGETSVSIPLPYGLYALRWMQVVRNPTSATPSAIYQACTPRELTLRAPLAALPINLPLAYDAPCNP